MATTLAGHPVGVPVEPSFLQLELNTSAQRRRQPAAPAEVVVDGLLVSTLALLAVGIASELDGRLLLALGWVYLHFRTLPDARQQAYVSCEELRELRDAIRALNRFDVWLTGGILLLLLGAGWTDTTTPPFPAVGSLSVRPRTLSELALTSSRRDGVVEHYRISTVHTNSHWVLQLREPFTLRISRDDPDLADIVMVLLYQAEGDDGCRFLDQGTIGRVFRLSRQMTNERIGLYRRRQRIEDVLARSRDNRALTPSVLNAVHERLLEDPFASAAQIRQRLLQQGILAHQKDISLATLSRAIQTVDYLAVRRRLQEMMGRGEIVPDHQKLCQMLLGQVAELADAAGKNNGQQLIPVAQLIGVPPSRAATRCSAAPALGGPPEEEFFEPSASQAPEISPGYRMSFLGYFGFGASYREIGSFLGVCASTVYRRLASIRRQMPSLQRRLGAIRYSGIVAVDEKYILAPKPHREGKMGRWTYLFVAIDPYSYDLLHAQVYPARSADCARAFLLSLKARGVLAPRVFVTDLWGPYETVIPEVFPSACHHQCVFHAEQAASTLMRDKLGADFRSVPPAEALRQAIVHVFRAGTRRTLLRRYGKLLRHKPALLADCPPLASVFDSLERHLSKLANAYGDRRLSIPRTNNAVERVIRTFTRRYKTMTGFERLETAQAYVELWACYYRFRPFSPDASSFIRNRCPLEIAGYDLEGIGCLDWSRPPP